MRTSSKPTAMFMALTLMSSTEAQLYKAPVQIETGLVQGYQALNSSTSSNFSNYQDITVWRGVPFAASTAGENRWKPPQPAAKFNGTFLASSYGPGCPAQAGPESGTAATSEDCLSVNVWSPATSANDQLPVALWSYGAGATSDDGTNVFLLLQS